MQLTHHINEIENQRSNMPKMSATMAKRNNVQHLGSMEEQYTRKQP